MDGITRAQFAYPEVNFRYVVAPSTELPNNREPLKMNATEMSQMFDLGKVDAINELPKAQGVTAKEFAQQNAEMKQVKITKPNNVKVDESLDVKEQIETI